MVNMSNVGAPKDFLIIGHSSFNQINLDSTVRVAARLKAGTLCTVIVGLQLARGSGWCSSRGAHGIEATLSHREPIAVIAIVRLLVRRLTVLRVQEHLRTLLRPGRTRRIRK